MLGRLRLARPDALLRLLGALARSHGHPHRHVRPQHDRKRRAQSRPALLPLHLHPLGAAAGSNPVALRQDT